MTIIKRFGNTTPIIEATHLYPKCMHICKVEFTAEAYSQQAGYSHSKYKPKTTAHK